MKKILSVLTLSLFLVQLHAQQKPIQLSGTVVDPYSGNGIPGIFVALQIDHAVGAMGGAVSVEDLVLDSTDRNGQFHLQLPFADLDSAVREYFNFMTVCRFGLEVRKDRSRNAAEHYAGYLPMARLLAVDTGFNFYDQNYVNNRTLILTGKNERIKKDTTGMVVKFYRGSAVRFQLEGDKEEALNYKLHIVVQELSKANGKIVREDYAYLDKTDLDQRLLLQSHVPLRIFVYKWTNAADKEKPLGVIRNFTLLPEEVKVVKVRASGGVY